MKKPSNIEGISWEGIILSDLGNIYLKQGEYAQAVKSFEQSLPLIQKVIHNQVSVRSNYNYDADNTGEQITRKVILRYWEGGLLSNLGVAYSKLGQYPKASNFLKQSLLISREVGDRSTESMTLGNLGSIDVEIGKEQQARERYQQALAIAQNLGLREQESLLLDKIARLLEKQKEPELAIAFYKQSVNVRETIRQDITKLPRESQESYTKSVADTYRALANLLIQQRRLPEAQAVLELLKLRELRDFTRDTRAIDSPGISLANIEKMPSPKYLNPLARSATSANNSANAKKQTVQHSINLKPNGITLILQSIKN